MGAKDQTKPNNPIDGHHEILFSRLTAASMTYRDKSVSKMMIHHLYRLKDNKNTLLRFVYV